MKVSRLQICAAATNIDVLSMKSTVSGFTRSGGLNPDSIQVALSGTPVDENSSNRVENVCLNGFFLESASIFYVIYHKKVISKKRRILSGISQVDGMRPQ